MCPVKLDAAFYHSLLAKRFRLLFQVVQCFGFLPYPFKFQQENIRKKQLSIKFLHILNRAVGFVMFSTAFLSCVTLYLCFPEFMYEEDVPPVLNIAYHLENGLKVLIVLTTLLWPQTCATFLRDIYHDLVHILVLYDDEAHHVDWILVSVVTVTKRFLILYFIDALVNSVTLCLVLDYPISTLICLSYLVPFLAVMMNVLQYNGLLLLIGKIAASLNDHLADLAVEASDRERSYKKPKAKHCYNEEAVLMENIKSQTLVATIDKLSTLHLELMKLTSKTNAHCGPVMVIILLCLFVEANVTLFELYLNIDSVASDLPMSDFIIWNLFVLTATNFSFFAIIARANHLIRKENERAMMLLHSFSCNWNSDQNALIEYYIGRYSYLPGAHTACGMVTLDMRLVPNVVAATTSILVILLQFYDSALPPTTEQSSMEFFPDANTTS